MKRNDNGHGSYRGKMEVAILGLLSLFALVTIPQCAGAQPRQMIASSRPYLPQEDPPKRDTTRAISMAVPVVGVDVVVTDDEGNYLTGLKKENFRVTEGGVRQKIATFEAVETPITIVLLLENSNLAGGVFTYNASTWAEVFLRQLEPKDWIALSTFSMRPNVEVDFTHNWGEVKSALASMSQPFYRDSNLFDALADTLNRLQYVQGKKSILLLASGIDTFSTANLDDTIDSMRQSNVAVYCVGVGEQLFSDLEMRGGVGGVGRLNYFQAQSQLRTFAEITGGKAWFPRFEGEIPAIMSDIAGRLRNQYSLTFTPANQKLDGSYRKINVELVAPDGGPLTVLDQNGKKRKFIVYARQGYQLPKGD